MANPDLAPGALDKPSRFDEKFGRRAAKEKNWREVSRQVDRRDNYRCRACHSACNADTTDLLERGHRHHLTFRSKGGQDVASNLITLCARCHDAVHVKRTLHIVAATSFGADGVCEFWRTNEGGEFLATREIAIGRAERD